MRIITVVGTRTDIIRLSLIIKKLDLMAEEHKLVHTGQNFLPSLSEFFFKELKIRKPDYILSDKQQSLGEQLATIYSRLEQILLNEKPDKMLILGNSNSGLSSILAARMGIPVYHMQAGSRCSDHSAPEEKNRRIIEAASTFHLPYTAYSKANLLVKGISPASILLSGNPIYEVIETFRDDIQKSDILFKLGLVPEKYFLFTAHRAENVDSFINLREILDGLNLVANDFNKPVICSIHPRTKSKLEAGHLYNLHPLIHLYEPFGFFDFVKLEQNAACVLTDSSSIQEECCILKVPSVTIRKATDRPETVECGSNIVSGINARSILEAVSVMLRQPKEWVCPDGYSEPNVSDKVVKFLFGNPSAEQ